MRNSPCSRKISSYQGLYIVHFVFNCLRTVTVLISLFFFADNYSALLSLQGFTISHQTILMKARTTRYSVLAILVYKPFVNQLSIPMQWLRSHMDFLEVSSKQTQVFINFFLFSGIVESS